MGFNNPVSNAAGTLIRNVMKSFNFVAGVAGWQISRDGNAEFNNAAIRGQLSVGPSPTVLVFGAAIPAVLSGFYNTFGVIYACQLAFSDATHYHYRVWMTENNFGKSATADGWVDAGVVNESILEFEPATAPNVILLGNALNAAPTRGVDVQIRGVSGTPLNPANSHYSLLGIESSVDLVLDGKSYGRGLIGFVSSNVSGLATVAEQQTLGAFATIKNKRAYEIRVGGQVLGSVANQAAFITIRRTNTAGPILLISGTDAVFVTVADHYEFAVNVINNSGADITDNVLQDISRAAGAGTVQNFATVGQPTWMSIKDIGADTDYPGAIQF